MTITPHLELKQSQSLLMTQQLRQAINLLQMSNLELENTIAQEIEKNPLLEREDDRLNSIDCDEQTIDDYNKEETPQEDDFTPDIDYDNNCDDDASDCEGYSYADPNQRSDTHTQDDDFDYIEQRLSKEKSLYQLLDEQIEQNFSSNRDKIIARLMAERLDAAGYFREDINFFSQNIKTSFQTVSEILARLQTFEPSGIFAQNLAECIAIQLRDKNRLDPLAQSVIDNLELLGAHRLNELKKKINISDEDLQSVLQDIKSVNPKPTADFIQDDNHNICPDVFVRRHKTGEYVVSLNQMTLPRVLINQDYRTQIISSKETDRYLRHQLNHATFLVKALHQRAETILKVSEALVKKQRDFFEYGIDSLQPMQLRDIADDVEIHESTVSRAINNKYIHTPLGIFSLKYFFSNSIASLNGQDDASTTTIKHKIKELIEQEPPQKVLSDGKIAEILATKNIQIARRTVAKYREALKIPTSAERKRIKRSAL